MLIGSEEQNTNNIHSKRTATVDTTGDTVVGRPANLAGFWVMPGVANSVFSFYNYLKDIGVLGPVFFELDVPKAGGSDRQNCLGMTLPGNGIRFDKGIWVVGSVNSGSLTVFYQ
jgi:hypothetical protein